MRHHHRWIAAGIGLALLGALLLSETRADDKDNKKPADNKKADDKKDDKKKADPPKGFKGFFTPKVATAPLVPRSSLLTIEAWQKAPMTPLKPGELDGLIAKELSADKVQPAPLTTDEQFIRRVTLDLTGSLPNPSDISEFSASTDPSKRAKLIDKLLESDAFARHWAHYWRTVFSAQLADPRSSFFARTFETWMKEQFQKNASWAEISTAILTAEGSLRFDEPSKNGAAFVLASHRGADAASERAAQVSRVFMGIQIQCAQCHDHPFDQWKRVQFHELAAYFARVRERPIFENMRIAGVQLVSVRFGEHDMPSKEDPKKSTAIGPRFLNGDAPTGNDLGDQKRREALAKSITDKNNYWFAGAYVNRIWGVLMGQSFYEPVDDMGPQKPAVFPSVLTRLTGSFRGSDYNVKTLFRDIMNSQTYQRQIRLSDPDEHLHFAAAYPTRLPADALWQSLLNVLGDLGGPRFGGFFRPGGGPGMMGRGGLEGMFKQEFSFDPSLRADEVENSIPQALLLMNNPEINRKIQATGTNVLARILSEQSSDAEALRTLYLRTLARNPTERELEKCRKYITSTGNRAEAFEDILWALLNSTEFQTKR